MNDVTPTQADPGKRRLSALMQAERPALRRASMASLLASLLWLGQAWLVSLVLSDLLLSQQRLNPALAAAAFVLIGAIRAGLSYWAEGRLFTIAETIVARERATILESESRAGGPGRFGGPGAVAALAREKLDALVPYVTRYAPAQARVAVVPIVILLIALSQSWAVAVIFLVAGPLIPVFMALVGYAARDASERQLSEVGAMGDVLVDRLSALTDIRVLNAGETVIARFADTAEDLRARTMAVLRVAFLSSTVLELFAAIGVAMAAVWVGFSLLGELSWGAWGGQISVQAGIFLLLLAPDYFQPLRDLSAAWHDKAAALAVAGDLARWDAEQPSPILGSGADAAPLTGPADITLHDLAVRRGERVIRYPDMQVAAGDSLALTGPSGAGKTTLLRLLAGLEAPLQGEIRVAGAVLNDETADAWRARLGWMPQGVHFLSRSLRYNIAFGATPDQAVIDGAVLGDVLASLPNDDRTTLGETGAGLSGGEGRRVMLARAMQARPDVLLADEPTADLDAQTAQQVIDGLLALAENGTTLIVATHDQRLIGRLGRVIALEGRA